MRAALEWSLQSEEGGDEFLRLAYVLWRYWVETGSISEGRRWLDAALAGTRPSGSVLKARALDACAFLAAQQGDYVRALELTAESEAIARSLPESPLVLGWCLFRRGQIQLDRGRIGEAAAALAEAAALFRAEDYTLGLAWALIELDRSVLLGDDLATARRGFAEVVQLEQREEETIALAYALACLGSATVAAGEADEGLPVVERGLEMLDQLGARFTRAIALLHAAPAYRIVGDLSPRARDP